jgi:hypothetical protein
MDSDIELNYLGGWGGGAPNRLTIAANSLRKNHLRRRQFWVAFNELCFLCLHATGSDVVAAHEANRYILFAVRRRFVASVRAILIK